MVDKVITPFDYFYADKFSVAGTLRSTNWLGLRDNAGIFICDRSDGKQGRTMSDEKFHLLMTYLWNIEYNNGKV